MTSLANSPFTNFPKTSAGTLFDDDWGYGNIFTLKGKAVSSDKTTLNYKAKAHASCKNNIINQILIMFYHY
jgi:hypothetical protein